MRLAVDFDGVLHDTTTQQGRHWGQPLPDAVEYMRRLRTRGHEVLIHSTKATTLSGLDAIGSWLSQHKIPYSEIHAKPQADYYIDDRAIQFHDWPQAFHDMGIR